MLQFCPYLLPLIQMQRQVMFHGLQNNSAAVLKHVSGSFRCPGAEAVTPISCEAPENVLLRSQKLHPTFRPHEGE